MMKLLLEYSPAAATQPLSSRDRAETESILEESNFNIREPVSREGFFSIKDAAESRFVSNSCSESTFRKLSLFCAITKPVNIKWDNKRKVDLITGLSCVTKLFKRNR